MFDRFRPKQVRYGGFRVPKGLCGLFGPRKLRMNRPFISGGVAGRGGRD